MVSFSRQIEPPPRLMLWIDAVGGYLACLADEVLLGQAVLDTDVDVPILGDLSRRHAFIRRQEDGYLIAPLPPALVRVDGRLVAEPALLADRSRIELGASVALCFRRPHPLSATARLDFLSRHRTQPSANGVLLLAESCVLGPRPQCHVLCRDWSGDVVLYKSGRGLACRTTQPIEIDGRLYEGRGQVTNNSHVAGSDFAMCLEEL